MQRLSAPQYFEQIRNKAAQRWDQLEADKELAAPWWQLFRQIQSPRHVLSELLQNADDAGAHSAEVRIKDGTFIFEHDGEDFTEEQFASLCQFGFSNKRHLHTIGFRGIGFKSTFSLGDAVELVTPTLSVRFLQHRFTEPTWIDTAHHTLRTRISVRLRDEQVRCEIEKSLEEWANSTLSLLFFQNICSLKINDYEIARTVIGEGPVRGSERIRLASDNEQEIVRISSPLEDFPADAIEEIRQERMAVDPDFSLPPCRVEIVVGVPGEQRLYVVLPTDRQTKLPFSVNAPFVQDPARMSIKDPSISPTNRWLLERVGRLAAESMAKWLAQEQFDLAERAEAYHLLPSFQIESDSCDSRVCTVFSEYLVKKPLLLASNGSLVRQCFVPPFPFYEIWEPDDIELFAGDGYEAVLSRVIQPEYRERLEKWGLIIMPIEWMMADWFRKHTVPRPSGYYRIIKLWTYIFENLLPRWRYHLPSWKIMPVEGLDILRPAHHLVRVGDSIRGLSEDDSEFLSKYLNILDRSFLQVATERLKNPDTEDNWIVTEILSVTNLEKDSAAKLLLEQAYSQCTSKSDHDVLIRFSHIAGFLNTDIPNNFLYVTRDGKSQGVIQNLALDISGRLEMLLPKKYADSHILCEEYLISLPRERRQQWIEWAESARSGLGSFVGIEENTKRLYFRSHLLEWLRARGGKEPEQYHIQRDNFLAVDYDVDPLVIQHLFEICSDSHPDPSPPVWGQIFDLIASDPRRAWKEKLHAECYQLGNKYKYPLSCGTPRASWISRLAETRCLPDTDGVCREPHELLLRNEMTEFLVGVEPFVRREYDIEEMRDLLLALGVRNTPGSPESILDRIRVFAGEADPPEYELVKLYEHLNELLKHCTQRDIDLVRTTFIEHRMIYTQEGIWAFPHEVFHTIPGGGMPGIYRVMPTLQYLPLWNRIGVLQEPTSDILIQQLKQLKSGSRIESQDRNRIRAILQREPYRVLNEIGHWINLDWIWKPVSELTYYISRSMGQGVDELFPSIKGATADMRMIDSVVVDPLVLAAELEYLQSMLSHRVTYHEKGNERQGVRPWMLTLGRALGRVQHDDPDEEKRMREIAARIADTVWTPVTALGVTPYLDGSPVGREQKLEVFWDDLVLYVQEMPFGRLLKVVPTELSRNVSPQSVKDAIVYCSERDPHIIMEYCEENFTLLPEDAIPEDGLEPDRQIANDTPDNDSVVLHVDGVKQINAERRRDEEGIAPEISVMNSSQETVADSKVSELLLSRKSATERPRRLSLIEILADKQRYQWDPVDLRYIHDDSSWIQKSEAPFHWEMCSPRGEVIGRFWVHDSALSKGVEIPAEVWGMIAKDPGRTAVILRADDDGLDAISGTKLLAMVKAEELGLFPAKFRLRRITE